MVFFVLKSLLRIAGQWRLEIFAILPLKPRSHVRISYIERGQFLTTVAIHHWVIFFSIRKLFNDPLSYKPSEIIAAMDVKSVYHFVL